MTNTIFFIDSKYSKMQIAARPLIAFALDGLNMKAIEEILPQGVIIFIPEALLGLTNSLLEEFVSQKKDCTDLIGTLKGKPVLVASHLSAPLAIDPRSFYEEIKNSAGAASCKIPLDGRGLKIIDCPVSLAKFQNEVQESLRYKASIAGVFMQDPSSVYLSYDTTFGEEITIEPNVYFGPGVQVGDRVRIRAFSYIEGVRIDTKAEIGPFARIRGNTEIGEEVKVGNFVEIKNSTIGCKTKVSHLSYIGDATLGKRVNVGAGVVTCNYDGFKKHLSLIKDEVFIGSNACLIAPISVGSRSFIGAASFINQDVPEDTLATGRARQEMKPYRRK